MNLGNHHAYVIEGEIEVTLLLVKKHLQKIFNLEGETSPDIMEFHFPSFLIEHSRLIREADVKAPFSLPTKSILISFDSITREAQNALLKVLEDPAPTSRFFIITTNSDQLLPTVRSRVEVLRHESFGQTESSIDVEKFIKSNQAKRLEIVGALLKDMSDEKLPKKAASNFIRALTSKLEEDVAKGVVEVLKLKSALKMLSYTADKSASQKLLLERIALC